MFVQLFIITYVKRAGESCGFHSVVIEDSGLMGYEAASLVDRLSDILTLEDEGTVFPSKSRKPITQ